MCMHPVDVTHSEQSPWRIGRPRELHLRRTRLVIMFVLSRTIDLKPRIGTFNIIFIRSLAHSPFAFSRIDSKEASDLVKSSSDGPLSNAEVTLTCACARTRCSAHVPRLRVCVCRWWRSRGLTTISCWISQSCFQKPFVDL